VHSVAWLLQFHGLTINDCTKGWHADV
jgi:hypothetical protein